MSVVKIQSNASNTGIFTLQSPDSSSDRTLTLPDAAGTFISSGNLTDITNVGTLGSGLDVTGTITADGLTVDGTGTLSTIGNGTQQIRTYVDADEVSLLVDGSIRLDFWTGGNKTMRLDSGGDISFYEDTGTTAKFFWDSSAESLGIGTASPSSLNVNYNNLVVGSGSGNEGITIYSGTSSYGGLIFADGTAGTAPYEGQLKYNHASNSMSFHTNAGSERMRIDSSGNLGIGTTAPLTPLYAYGTNTNNWNGRITASSDGAAAFVSTYTTNGTHSPGIFAHNTALNAWNDLYINAHNDGSGGLGGGTSNKVIIAGNVGINEMSPASPLDVHVGTDQNLEVDSNGGELRLSAVNDARNANPAMRFQATSYKFYGNSGAGPYAAIDSSGNVGIGTTPSAWRPEYSDRALDIGTHSAIYDQTGTGTWITNNVYRATSNPLKYKITAGAGYLAMDGGTLSFSNAPSGTAGTTATFTERMAVDTSGRVTKPYQPSFKAGLNNGVSPISYTNNTTAVAFNSTGSTSIGEFNRGNHYSTSTGLFTAPVSGVYHFASTLLWQDCGSTAAKTEIYFKRNGTDLITIGGRMQWASGSTGWSDGYLAASTSATVYLSANDTIGVYWLASNSSTVKIHNNAAWSFFSGHLVA